MKTEKNLLHRKIQKSVFVFILIRTLSVFADVEVSLKFDPKRGSPAEYDAGAPISSKWLELYGSTPNYRSIGIETLNGQAKLNEKFRWEFGPMWYRGRLTPESVKVFIVGQEGAQDENISNRAFTGSTGTRVQKFLNHLGIYRSYLFMNTFVYTINGQLEDDPKFKWIEQGETSPIVDYRHKLFDYMLETNSQTISLFIGVGRGGKASLATWINSRGGKCSVAYEMANCDTNGMVAWFAQHRNLHIKNNIVAVGVPHPGGANPNLGGDAQLENIRKGFTQAAKRVAAYKTKNKNWLTKDIDEMLSEDDLVARLNKPYVYRGYAPIPFRDFAFNTNWRMGSQGTTSNRWGSSSIQIYSDLGVYNEKKSTYKRPRDLDSGLNSTKTALLEMSDRDLAYESPRFNKNTSYVDYDFGPCGYLRFDQQPCELAKALVSWPDLKQQGINFISHESFGYFGTYRGHAKNARVFIIADQTSHDDMFSTRALTGTSGQKSQMFFDEWSLGSAQKMVDLIYNYYGWITPNSKANYLLYTYQTEPDSKLGTAFTDNYLTKYAPVNRAEYCLKFTGKGTHDFDVFGAMRTLQEYEVQGLPVRIFGFPSFFYFTLQRMKDLKYPKLKLSPESLVFLGG
ncbi:MAG: hypothetical protein ACK41T_11845, partial [Pseudobdellovibrio sp.]